MQNQQTCPLPTTGCSHLGSQLHEHSLQYKVNHSRESRQDKMSRMRQLHSMSFIGYEGVSFNKFAPIVERENNTYTLLATIFSIVDNFTWRQYITHLEVLIKKITNLVQASKGKVLEEISNKQLLGGYHFQERLESMLHLSSKEFQQHLLIFIHAMIAYNKRYCLLDEPSLSDHLARKHPYAKFILEDVLWLLTRMSVSTEAVTKVAKNYLQNSESSPLLPVLTILANYIYQQPQPQILSLISTTYFQQLIQKGALSNHFETERETAFICNNLLLKSTNCHTFITGNQNLVAKIRSLPNEESQIFGRIVEGGGKILGAMEDQHHN